MRPTSPMVRQAAGSVAIGVAASTVMSLTTALQKKARPPEHGPVDYDASRHVAQAVGAVLGRPPQDRTERGVYFVMAHWGYGSAVAMAYRPLLAASGHHRWAGLAFYAGCQAMALGLLPALGGTPPPTEWSRRLLVTSLVQHGVYAGVVVAGHRFGPRLIAAAGDPTSSTRR